MWWLSSVGQDLAVRAKKTGPLRASAVEGRASSEVRVRVLRQAYKAETASAFTSSRG